MGYVDPHRNLSAKGEFRHQRSQFRDFVSAEDGAPFPAESGRYHLYVSLACPWAHRTIIARRLKGLEHVIGMSIVDPIRDGRGWAFTGAPGTDRDPVHHASFLAELYELTEPGPHHVSVPVLFDRR